MTEDDMTDEDLRKALERLGRSGEAQPTDERPDEMIGAREFEEFRAEIRGRLLTVELLLAALLREREDWLTLVTFAEERIGLAAPGLGLSGTSEGLAVAAAQRSLQSVFDHVRRDWFPYPR